MERPRSTTAGAWAVAAGLGLAALVSPAIAAAQDFWRRPHPGMRHLHRRAGVFDYHLVMVDLRTPGLRLVSTREDELAPRVPGGAHRWETTSAFARRHGVEVAINANYYDIHHAALTACGMAMGGGRVFGTAYADRRLDCWESVGFAARGGKVAFFDSRGRTFGPAPAPWISEVVTGSPRVLRDGEVEVVSHPRHARSRNPRTVVGADRARDTLYLLVVNGREGRNQGMTTAEAGRTLREFGAWDAVNLDGGGSSTLWMRAEGGLVSHLADGYERPVATHLGVAFDAPPEPTPPEAPEMPMSDTRLAVVDAPVPTPTPTAAPRVAQTETATTVATAGLGGEGLRRWWLGPAGAMLLGVFSWSARRRSPRTPRRGSRP